MPVILFIILHLSTVIAIVALHAARSRVTLAPIFAGCAILSFLIWQLLQTGWWVAAGPLQIDAALFGPLPAILAGLTLVYAMDGVRAARAYVLTFAVSALVSILHVLFLAELSEHVPIASFFVLPLSTHLAVVGGMVLGGIFSVSSYEVARRLAPIGLAMAVGLAVGLLIFLAGYSLLAYGVAMGMRNIVAGLGETAAVAVLPCACLGLYGWFAERAHLVQPARRLFGLLAGWQKAEAEIRTIREDFLKASETISELRERERNAFTRTIAERVRGIQMTAQVINHDFANLMLAIEGNLARIRAELPAEMRGGVDPSLRAIRDAAQRGREMLRQLGSQQPFALSELKNHDLLGLVDEALNLQRPVAASHGVGIAVEGAAGIVIVADRTQMVRMLMNLIGNAIRACSEQAEAGSRIPGGHIRITIGSDAGSAKVLVADDGIGMTAEQLGRAFDPGFSTKGEGRGGLGLAISYLIVDAHGGRLSLASQPGLGTTATIQLPIGTIEAMPPESAPLLLLFSDEARRARLAEWLLSVGGEAVEIASAAELQAILGEQPENWELVVRSHDFPLPAALRRQIEALPQLLIGPRRAVAYRPDKCRLPPLMVQRIAALAAGERISGFASGERISGFASGDGETTA